MDERVMRFRVGAVVFVSLLILVVLVLLVGVSNFLEPTYTVYAHFPSAPGVTTDTPVRKHGIFIGRVDHVRLVDDGVIMALSINAQYTLRQDERPRVGGGSLLGDSVISFVKYEDPAVADPAPLLKDGDHVQGMVAADPFQVIYNVQDGIDRVVDSITVTSQEIGLLARDLRGLVGDNENQMQRLLRKSEETLDKVGRAAESLDSLVQDPQMRENLRTSLAELPALLRDARQASVHAQQAMAGLGGVVAGAQRNLDNIERFTGPLAEEGPRILQSADRSLQSVDRSLQGAEGMMRKLAGSADKLERLMDNLIAFSDALNREEGSLARFLNDQELYDNLHNASHELNRLIIETRPVIANARTFTDKIARHPETLGVGGAIRGSSGAKPVNRRVGDAYPATYEVHEPTPAHSHAYPAPVYQYTGGK